MAYSKQDWNPDASGNPKYITPSRMNHIETGIENVANVADKNASDVSVLNSNLVKIEENVMGIKSSLSVIGNKKQFTVGSDAQNFKSGDNDLTVVTDLQAGLYLLTVNGVHETSANQYQIQNIELLAGSVRIRNYYGGINPTTAMAYVVEIPDNAIIGISIRINDDCTTYSVWNIQAIRLK